MTQQGQKPERQGPNDTPPVKKGDANVRIAPAAIALLIIAALVVAAYARNKVYHDAITLWASVVKRAPEKRRAHENYGQALSSAGSYKAALQEFKKVMELKDDGTVPARDLYREIGVVYYRLGQSSNAIMFWKIGLREAPGDPTLLNNLAAIYLQLGQNKEAAAVAEMALSADPSMSESSHVMGKVAMENKDYDAAAEYFMRQSKQDPGKPEPYWDAALALEKAKKYDLACEYLSRYLAVETNPRARQLAQQYLELLKIKMRR
jgi:tetratricopeptide (TPR) repeat protein